MVKSARVADEHWGHMRINRTSAEPSALLVKVLGFLFHGSVCATTRMSFFFIRPWMTAIIFNKSSPGRSNRAGNNRTNCCAKLPELFTARNDVSQIEWDCV